MSFADGLTKIKMILLSLSGIAPLLTLFGVAIPPLAIAAVPATIALMGAAENALGDGTGPLKKQAVTAGMTAFAGTMQAASTGGQKETWDKFTPEVTGALIDTIAAVANSVAVASNSEPVFDDSVFEAMKAGR